MMHLRILVLLLVTVAVSPCDIAGYTNNCLNPMIKILTESLQDILNITPGQIDKLCTYFLVDGKVCVTEFVTNCAAFTPEIKKNLTTSFNKQLDVMKPYCTKVLPRSAGPIDKDDIECMNEASERCWQKLKTDESARCDSLTGCMRTEIAACNLLQSTQTVIFSEFTKACKEAPVNAGYYPAARKGEAQVLPSVKPPVRKTTTAHGASVKVVPATAVLSFAILFSFLLTEDTK